MKLRRKSFRITTTSSDGSFRFSLPRSLFTGDTAYFHVAALDRSVTYAEGVYPINGPISIQVKELDHEDWRIEGRVHVSGPVRWPLRLVPMWTTRARPRSHEWIPNAFATLQRGQSRVEFKGLIGPIRETEGAVRFFVSEKDGRPLASRHYDDVEAFAEALRRGIDIVVSEHRVPVPRFHDDFEVDTVRTGFPLDNGFLKLSDPVDVRQGFVRLVGQRGEVYLVRGRPRAQSTQVVGRWVCGSGRIEWLFMDPPRRAVGVRVLRRRDGEPVAKARIDYEELGGGREEVFRHRGHVFSDAEGRATMFLEARRYRVVAASPPGWVATYTSRTSIVDARRDDEVVFEVDEGVRVVFDFSFRPPPAGRANNYTLMARRDGRPWETGRLGMPFEGYSRVMAAGVWRILAFCNGYFGEKWVRIVGGDGLQRIGFDMWPAERVEGRVVWRDGNVAELRVHAGPRLEGVGPPPWARSNVSEDGTFALWLAGTTERTLVFLHEGRRVHEQAIQPGAKGETVVIE